MWIKLFRTFKSGMKNLFRNGWLTVATVSIIAITLFIINIQAAVVFANYLLLKDVQSRVNISVYFNEETTQVEIEEIRKEIESYQEVSVAEFVSQEQALKDFKNRNEKKNEEVIKEALEMLGYNPLRAALNVKAHNSDDYKKIDEKIKGADFFPSIYKVNYHKYSSVIDNLNKDIQSNQRIAVAFGATLSVIAILITFNSIRITMYSHRQEIEIMRLVGASNNYIRMPFVWEGFFYGIFAALLAIPLTFAYLHFVSAGEASGSILPFSQTKFLRTFLEDYFFRNLVLIVLFQFIFGMFLGVLSSVIAIRRYLKI